MLKSLVTSEHDRNNKRFPQPFYVYMSTVGNRNSKFEIRVLGKSSLPTVYAASLLLSADSTICWNGTHIQRLT